MYFVLISVTTSNFKRVRGSIFIFFDTKGKNNYKENPLKQLPSKRSKWKAALEDRGNSLEGVLCLYNFG